MLQYEGYQFEMFPEPEISRPNTEPDGVGVFCVACNAIPGATGLVVTRSVGLASCLAVVTGAGGLTVCSVKSPASAPSLLTATGVSEGAAGAAVAVLAGVAVCDAGPVFVEVVAADVSPGSLTVEVVELNVVTERGSTNSCVTVVLCPAPDVPVVAAVVVVAVVVVVVVAVVVVDVLLEVEAELVDVVEFALDVVVVAGGAGAGATKTAALVLATTVATACVMACSTTTLVVVSSVAALAAAASAIAFAAAASAAALAAAAAAVVLVVVAAGVTMVTGVSLELDPPPPPPPTMPLLSISTVLLVTPTGYFTVPSVCGAPAPRVKIDWFAGVPDKLIVCDPPPAAKVFAMTSLALLVPVKEALTATPCPSTPSNAWLPYKFS